MNIIKLSNTSYWISVQGSLVQLYIEVILFSLLQLSSQWIFYTEELTVSINPLIHIKDSTHFFFQFYYNILFFFLCLYIAVNTHVTFESFSHFILYNVCFLVLKGFPSISFFILINFFLCIFPDNWLWFLSAMFTQLLICLYCTYLFTCSFLRVYNTFTFLYMTVPLAKQFIFKILQYMYMHAFKLVKSVSY